MNTRINYQYRDADNYKVYNAHVIVGGMTIEQESRIIECLDDGLFFIPEQVNLPEEKFGAETEADHPWFEWLGYEPTDAAADLNITADELVTLFEKAGNGWQEVRTAPNDGRIPYCVTIQETMSRTVIIWAHERIEAETTVQELCNNGTIDLDGTDFDERNCTCDGVATARDLKTFKEYQ